MEDIEISYNISFDDYVHAYGLLRQKSVGAWRGARLYLWMAAIIFVVLIGYQKRYGDFDVLWGLLLLPGGYFLFQAALYLLPPSWYRFWLKRHYGPLPDGIYNARFSADRVTVTENTRQCILQWAAFQKIAEDAEMFVFFDGMTMFIFARRFFTPEQIGGLQELIRNRSAGDCRPPNSP